ncbi:MAG: DUF4160 domain-containing protein [Armatimonadetes bacterium]|nr:DUF4160 domain-containing protein [Armatimonadota bacterium]
MPTVLRIGRFRFFFYSNENQEPPHIHVKAAENEAKFWLHPVRLAFNHGYRSHELNEVERLVRDNQTALLEAWNGYFSREQL